MALSPTKKKAARDAIADFCRRAEAHELRWHYTQARPFRGFGVAPENYHANDCSGYVSLAFNWAMQKTDVWLADPLGERYTGWGYTGTEIEWLERHGVSPPGGKYRIGDIAIYGSSRGRTTHTTICRRAGSDSTSIWSSHGTEGGPDGLKLRYRGDVLGVWRHPALT